MRASHLLVAITLLPLSGCALFGYTSKVDVEHQIITLESGVQYREILPGEGDAAELGQEISIDYTGFLTDGTIFDSSIERGYPFEFILGEAPLAGWDEGIAGMRVGGRRHVSIPPALAYGEAGIDGLVPPNEVLVFEFELLEIR